MSRSLSAGVPKPVEAGAPATAPATLGDLLYARPSTTRASEQEWVELVRAIADQDLAALHALYERAHRLVFTLAVQITMSLESAEEVVLDVFQDVWRTAAQYDPRNGTVLGWIMNLARARALGPLQ
jgi:RNA polymerase sigma-70 factor (ECF subfamily)